MSWAVKGDSFQQRERWAQVKGPRLEWVIYIRDSIGHSSHWLTDPLKQIHRWDSPFHGCTRVTCFLVWLGYTGGKSDGMESMFPFEIKHRLEGNAKDQSSRIDLESTTNYKVWHGPLTLHQHQQCWFWLRRLSGVFIFAEPQRQVETHIENCMLYWASLFRQTINIKQDEMFSTRICFFTPERNCNLL